MAVYAIKGRSFSYHVDGQRVTKYRGEHIDTDHLTEDELAHAEKFGYFGAEVVAGVAVEPEEEIEEVEIGEMSIEELAHYLKHGDDGESPLNVSETVALMGTEPALAKQVLAAENEATGNEPRTGVLKAAEKIASAS